MPPSIQVLFGCVVFYVILERLTITKQVRQRQDNESKAKSQRGEDLHLLASPTNGQAVPGGAERRALHDESTEPAHAPSKVTWKIRAPMFSVAFTFFVTLAVFPSVTSSIVSEVTACGGSDRRYVRTFTLLSWLLSLSLFPPCKH